MSKAEAERTTNVKKIPEHSLISMMSPPGKSRGRLSETARVVFEEPSSSSSDQKHSPSVSIDEESMKRTTSSHLRNVEIISITDGDQVGTDSHDTLKAIEARTKRHFASQAELSRPPSGPLKGDTHFEIETQTDRESTKRSTRLLGHSIEGMFAQYPQVARFKSHHHEEGELMFPTTIGTSAAPSGTRMRFSDNVGVQSLAIEVPPTDCLSTIEATAFGVILEETLDLLDILEHVIPARIDERWDESYKTIDEKYGIPKEPKIMFREDMGLLPLVPTVFEKIQRDRTYVYNALKGTTRDIQCTQRYDRLETEVDDIVRILEGEHNLEVNHEIWMGQVNQLHELIDSDRIHKEEDAKKLLLMAHRMNAEVDNQIFSNSTKLGYVERWEEARVEQQKLRLDMKEQETNDALEDCTTMERADRIISIEMTAFLEGNTKDLEEEVISWTSRYNEEIEHAQQQINDTKEKIELQKLDMQNLQELREERQIFLDKCNEEKELAEREIEYWAAVNNAATIIQAIWRGYMVRHKLGRYKKLWASFKKKKKRNQKGKKRTKKKTTKN